MRNQDKTKQQLIEELAELRRSEAKWRSVAENAPLFVAIVDQSGTIQFLNRFQAGFEPATVIGRPIYDFLQTQHHTDPRKCLELVFQTGEATSYETVGAGPDGTLSDYVTDVGPVIVDGEIIAATLISRDITDRNRAEEALRESESRFRSLFRDCVVGMVVAATTGEFIQVNPAFCEFLGYSEQEIIGKTVRSVTHPDDWAKNSVVLHRHLSLGSRIERFEKRYLHKDGHVLWGEVSSTLVYNAEGIPAYFIAQVLDIGKRKRTEEALQKARDELEEKVRERTAELSVANEQLRIFQQFAEASGQGFSMADLSGHLLYMNPALCRMLGEDKPHDRIGQHVSIYYSDEVNRKRETERFSVLMRDGYWQGELPMLSRQGESIPTWHNTFLIRDESGEPFRIAVVITDISERKRAEEALRQSHEELQAIYDGMPDGLLVADIETKRFVRCNAAIRQMLGYSEDKLLSRSVMDIHPADEMSRVLETFHALVAGGQRVGQDIPLLRNDGSVFHVDVTHSEITLNERKCSVGFFRDITERKQAQEALQRSEERYALAVQGAGVGIWDWDIRNGTLYFSPRWKMLFGYDESDVGDSLDDWVRLLHPDERDSILRFLNDFLEGSSPTVTVEYRLRHKDGSYRWIVAHGVVVRDERGRACRLVGSHGDITDRKCAEEALERERQSLWRMLQASDHERQIISYEIHDGLTQYLAAATMQFQANDALREDSPEAAKKAYETAVELVRQAHAESRRLISEVRPPVIDEVGIETAISHLVHEHRRRGGPKIECRSSVQFNRLPPILENAIYRITQEALTNACKHSKSKEVKVTMTQEDQDIRLEVQDWGIGFDPESVEKGHFGVEGIRQRVRLLGGRLTIESKPGSGTLVQVVVPIVERKDEE